MLSQLTSASPLEMIFLGDAPGQSDRVCIGGSVYVRGETYPDVPPEHRGKGGFYMTSAIDGLVVVHRRPQKSCIVLGTAPTMWDDLAAAPQDWDVVAVNTAGCIYRKPIAMWCSIHGNKLAPWIEKRREAGCDMDFVAYGNFTAYETVEPPIEKWNKPNANGSSGLFAVLVALARGYTRIVLCGIPIDGTQRHNSDGDVVEGETEYKHYRTGWYRNKDVLRAHVRSMSGWTAEYLGAPDDEWLNEPGEGKHERVRDVSV